VLGILLIVVSTAFLSASDVASKYLTATLPAAEIAWLRYVGFCLLVIPAGLMRDGVGVFRSVRPDLQLLRGVGMIGSVLFFTSALRFLPVAEATAASFVSPIFITGLSVLFLGESAGIRRWLAALVGFTGVLVIIRPGTAAFQPATLLPILAAASWATAVVTTRKLARHDRLLTTLVYSALSGFLILCVVTPFNWVAPGWPEIAVGAVIGVASTTGHWLVAWAYRLAPASMLAPFSYVHLLYATLFGYLVFRTLPDAWTWAGAGLIIASGLYTAHRERVRARERSILQAEAEPTGR
jgi:drug/metabolite transporter (DMT)-like permease